MRRWQVWFFGRPGQLLFWVAVVLAGSFLVASGAGRVRWWWPFERPGPAVVVSPVAAAGPTDGWAAVAKATMPAVVNIASTRTVRESATPSRPFFFGPELAPRRERSLGSGVIVTPDGYVLTNNHVVEGAQDIRVALADRREFKVQVVGTDPHTDVAVLKLPGSSFPVVAVGDSNRVVLAEVVLALGNPFGLAQTVTMGIVSAVGRANVGIADYEDFIQTDAAINPGNSGGALVNARGELIGINTAIFTESGGYMGIGFAVPINMARQVMDHLVRHGRVVRGYLGLAVQDLTPAVARGLGFPAVHGILVGDTIADGPAARAGIERGDVISAIDGKPVDDAGHFRNLVASTAPGARVRLTIVRDGRQQTVEVTVRELPERRAVSAAPGPLRPDPLGVSLSDMTPELARRLRLAPETQGAVIAEAIAGGAAAEAGLRPGDVIQEVNRRPVRSARDFAQAVEQGNTRDLVLLVNRAGSTAYVVIERGG